jgi:PilZ domain
MDAGHASQSVERRRWNRIPLTIPLFIRRTRPDGRTFIEFATALNVSAGGVLLASRHDVTCGEVVLLEVPRPIREAPLSGVQTSFTAITLRSRPTRHYFLLGMQFEPPLL